MSEDADRTRNVKVLTGVRGSVVAVRTSDGSVPAVEFLDRIGDTARRKYLAKFTQHADVAPVRGTEHIRRLEVPGTPPVFELKVHKPSAYRLYFVPQGSVWYLTHGANKPKDSQVPGQVARARQIFADRRPSP